MITELLNINLVEALGLSSLPAEQREKLIVQMSEVIENRINTEVLSILTEDEKKELDKVLDSDSDMIEFLKSKIPNFEIMVVETVANFKKEMLELQQLTVKA